ncbi:MAG: portal protein [Pseudomonadota bacterium]
MLEHKEMMINFRDSSSYTEMREECLKDLECFFIDNKWWAGNYGVQFKNKPRPEFNKIWKAINRVVGDICEMELNAIIVSNSDEATDEDSELLQKRWRNDFNASDGAEASEIATMEAAIGGFGCTKMVSKFEDEENPNPERQYLCSEIIHSACTHVFFDAASIRKDKADSRYGWQLIRTNRKAIEEEYGKSVTPFAGEVFIATDNAINYRDNKKDLILAHYWEVVEKKLTTYDFSAMVPLKITTGDGIKDEFGNKYTREDLKEMRDDYKEQIGEDVPTTKRKIKCVEYALCDGEGYLEKAKTPFKRVPLFPRYGYHTVINGNEYYCGEVRKRRDTEMFQNMYGSTMMEIMAAPQIPKPEYLPEQIAAHAAERSRADIDNAAFLLSDPVTDANGNITHMGPIGYSQPPQMGTGLQAAGAFLEQNTAEHNGMGSATVPANTSASAVQAVNERQDDTYTPMVRNTMHAIKAQCEAWIPAAQAIYFSNQRKIRVEEADGNYAQVTTLEMKQMDDGSYGPYGNAARGRYSVMIKQGQSYKDTKAAELEQNLQIVQAMGTDTPVGQMASLQLVLSTTGEGTYFSRKIARFQQMEMLMGMGIDPEPQNPEEEQYIQQKMQQMQMAAQSQQETPEMVAARAQEGLAQAEMIKAKNAEDKNKISLIDAETRRIDVVADAEAKGIELQRKDLESKMKLVQSMQPKAM